MLSRKTQALNRRGKLSLFNGTGFRVCVRAEIFKFSPAGTAECSPGRQSWVCAAQTKSPVGTTES